jgi:hypothetical protein
MGFSPNKNSAKAGGIRPHFLFWAKALSFLTAHHALKGVAKVWQLNRANLFGNTSNQTPPFVIWKTH